ncbi:MAG: HAD family hydrolase [Acidobacteriota bacterium]|nr:HAD family hydrolase [Acidobacteriota bacterium]
MIIQAAIFDIDGTLLNSVDLHAEAWRLALRHFGKIVPTRIIRTQIGKGGDQLLPVFLGPDEQRAFGAELIEYRGKVWTRDFMSLVKPFPRVPELLATLRARGVRVALASSCKKPELDHYKKLLKIDDLVQADASADDAARSKPHPDIFQAAVARAGVARSRSIAIGDTPYDAEAARKAGLTAIGVLCGGFPEESLRVAGCAAIYRNPAVLLAEIDTWIGLA